MLLKRFNIKNLKNISFHEQYPSHLLSHFSTLNKQQCAFMIKKNRQCRNSFKKKSKKKFCYLHQPRSTEHKCRAFIKKKTSGTIFYKTCDNLSLKKNLCGKHVQYNLEKFFFFFRAFCLNFSLHNLITFKNFLLISLYKTNFIHNFKKSYMPFIFFLQNLKKLLLLILNNGIITASDFLFQFKFKLGWYFYNNTGPIVSPKFYFKNIDFFIFDFILANKVYQYLFCNCFSYKCLFIFLYKNFYWLFKTENAPTISAFVQCPTEINQRLSKFDWSFLFQLFPHLQFYYPKTQTIDFNILMELLLTHNVSIFKPIKKQDLINEKNHKKKEGEDLWKLILKIVKELVKLQNYIFTFSTNNKYSHLLHLAELKAEKKNLNSKYYLKKTFFLIFMETLTSEFFLELLKEFPEFNCLLLRYNIFLIHKDQKNFFDWFILPHLHRKFSIISDSNVIFLFDFVIINKIWIKTSFVSLINYIRDDLKIFKFSAPLNPLYRFFIVYITINRFYFNNFLKKWDRQIQISTLDFLKFFTKNPDHFIFYLSTKSKSYWLSKDLSLSLKIDRLIQELSNIIELYKKNNNIYLSNTLIEMQNSIQSVIVSFDQPLLLQKAGNKNQLLNQIVDIYFPKFYNVIKAELNFQAKTSRESQKLLYSYLVRCFETFFFWTWKSFKNLLNNHWIITNYPGLEKIKDITDQLILSIKFKDLLLVILQSLINKGASFTSSEQESLIDFPQNVILISQPDIIELITVPILWNFFELFLNYLQLSEQVSQEIHTSFIDNLKFIDHDRIIHEAKKISVKFLFFLEASGIIVQCNQKWFPNVKKHWGVNLFQLLPQEKNLVDILDFQVVKKLPSFTEPVLETENLVKPIHAGQSLDQLSKETLKAIQITQNKKYKINVLYLNLLEALNESQDLSLNLGFPTNLQLNEQKKKLDFIIGCLGGVDRLILLKELLAWSKLNKKWNKSIKDSFRLFKKILNLSYSEYLLYKQYIIEKKKYQIMRSHKKKFYEVTKLARLFSDVPLYYEAKLDYRGRMYTLQMLWAKTTGIFKLLICDYSSVKISLRGFINLLLVYFSADTKLYKKYNIFLKKTKKWNSKQVKIELIKFFYFNKINKKNVKNFLYFSLMELEIQKLIASKTFSTNFCVEFDQKASAPALVARLIGNKKLAYWTNWTSPKSKDIYIYIMKNFSKTVKKIKSKKFNKYTKQAVKILISHRDFFKKSVMKFFYSQEWLGRYTDWKKLMLELVGAQSKEVIEELKWLSINFEKILNDLFPNLMDSLSILNEIFKLALKSTNSIILKSLDGSIFSWRFFSEVSKTCKIWNHQGQEYKSLRYNIVDVSGKNPMKRSLRSSIPGLVHCLDASIVRLTVLEFYNKHKYALTHLHDSFSVNVEFIDQFYELIRSFYKNHKNKNWLYSLLISPMLEKLSSDDQKKLKILYKSFQKLQTKINCRYFLPSNMYPPES